MAIVEDTQFGRIGAFRFWCQKVLPAVYDDSLSYYELLCKIADTLNQVIETTNTQSDAIAELQDAVENFIEHWHDYLDDEIEEVVDEWFRENEYQLNGIFAVKFNDEKEPIYFCRLKSEDYIGTTNPQSMCLKNDYTALVAYTNSDTNNNTNIVEIDLKNNVISNVIPSTFGHCNGMCYHPIQNKVYICPAGDYSQTPTAPTPFYYICNSYTLAIEETVDTSAAIPGETPHSIAYDPFTEKMYLTTYVSGVGTIKMYEITADGYDFICVVPTSTAVLDNYYNFGNTYGTQNLRVYNNKFYYLLGGNAVSMIIQFNASGVIENIMNIKDNVYIYTVLELQGFDFTTKGDIVCFGRASTCNNKLRFGVVFGININSGMVSRVSKLSPYTGISYVCHVDSSNNSIDPSGSSDNPFPTLDEAIAAVYGGYYHRIDIDSNSGDYYLSNTSFVRPLHILAGNTNNIIHLPSAVTVCPDLYIQNGTLTVDSQVNNMFSLLGSKLSLYYVTLDCSNVQHDAIYMGNSVIELSYVTATNIPVGYNVVNGRETSFATIVQSSSVSAVNVLSPVKKYIGIVGDSFSVQASGSPNGDWVDAIASEYGYSVVNASVNGSGFNESTNFLTQFNSLVSNVHFSEMEYIIIYGGLNDFTHNNETIANMTTKFTAIKTAYENAVSQYQIKPKLIFAFGNLGLPKRSLYNGYQKWYAECMDVLRDMGMPGLVEYVPYWLTFLPSIADYFEADSTHPSTLGQGVIAGMFSKIISGTYTGVKREYYFGSTYIDSTNFTNFTEGHVRYSFDNGTTSIAAAITADSVDTANALDTKVINNLDSISPYIGDTSGNAEFVLLFGTTMFNGDDKAAAFIFNVHNSIGYIRARGTAQNQSYPITGMTATGMYINE